MNFITITSFLLLLLTVSLLAGHGCAYGIPARNGEPGCQTEEEITVQKYRHIVKTLYWECTALGKPAVLRNCTEGFGFLDPVGDCVPFSLWFWTPFLPPPSAPVVAPAAAA